MEVIQWKNYFNPRFLAGATMSKRIEIGAFRFQSTLPYGSDRFLSFLKSLFLVFQSTLPCGSDSIRINAAEFILISIHAPLRERPTLHNITSYLPNFNPRSLTGATRAAKLQCTRLHNFNPRSLTGATQGAQIIRNAFIISIHAPSRERPG